MSLKARNGLWKDSPSVKENLALDAHKQSAAIMTALCLCLLLFTVRRAADEAVSLYWGWQRIWKKRFIFMMFCHFYSLFFFQVV